MSYPHTFRTKNTETKTTSSFYGSFYEEQARPTVAIPEEIKDMFNYVDKFCKDFVKVLKDFVEIPNVSGKFEYNSVISDAIEMVEKWFRKLDVKYERYDIGWCEMTSACCKMPNVLLGYNVEHYSRSKKTILVYTFLDVCAPGKEWKTDPFKLVDTGEYLFGKGVARGKGPLVCWLTVLDIYKKHNKELPVNVKFIVESLHEQNNAGLEKFLHSKRNKFLADVDYIILNESEWLGTRMPCLAYGAVGFCKFDVTVKQNQSSDPKADMEKIFDTITDAHNNIIIPGFNDHVIQISPEEEQIYDAIDYDFDAIKSSLPPDKQNWDKLRILMKFWRLPDILIGPIVEDTNEKNEPILRRMMTIKIVPLQLPENVGQMVTDHIFQTCDEMDCKSIVECQMVSGTKPWLGNFRSKSYQAARRAILQVYKEDPNLIREDREIPIILLLRRVIDRSVLLFPVFSVDCQPGRPNENVNKVQFFNAIKVFITFLDQLANG